MANIDFTPDPAGTLNPEDTNFFRQGKRRIKDSYFLGLAQNDHQKTLADSGQRRSLADLTRGFDDMRQKLPGSFANRGMLNSGAYQQTLTDFQGDKARAFQNQRDTFAESMGGLNLASQQLETVRNNATFDLEEQEAARRAAIAAAINPRMGYA